MNAHALSVLQFGQVLETVAGYAATALGAARVRRLTPDTDAGRIEGELARVAAMRAMIAGDTGWTAQPIPDLEQGLARLRLVGTFLPGPELYACGQLLRSSRLTSDALGDAKAPPVARGVLAPLRDRLVREKRHEDAIQRSLDPDGGVRDEASPQLRRVRRELRGAEGELVALLERTMARLEPHWRVSDASVTVRNGRYVIPVRREGRGAVGGLVHDTSASGATLFVEPPAAIEACNRIRELEGEEAEEVDRVLRELCDQLRPHAETLLASLEALVELDALYARARYADAFGCAAVRLRAPEAGFRVHDGRHPLLLAQGGRVVPFDLEMLPAEHTLLVSGPNTGGKTVLLKALGLLSTMVQSGIPAPAAKESELALYDDVFADVGDEQSIEASLSTFSAHLKNLAEILRSAGPRCLVLIDELGSGTDPLEGAALGGAILEALTTRGTSTVATTHLGALKELASQVPGIVNASLEFDAAALAPTYRVIKGIPGRSYGLSIARRLALPAEVLERAEARVPSIERDVNALLAVLEARDAAMASRERELADQLQSAHERAQRLAAREHNVRSRERALERESRREARRYLLEARREVEETIRSLKAAPADALDATAREARRALERMADAQGRRLDALDEPAAAASDAGRSPPVARELSAGDTVAVAPLDDRVGVVVDLREGGAVVVALGAVKVTYPRSALRPVASADRRETTVPIAPDLPEVTVATEIDVRGLRVGEVDDRVLQALDAAIRADLRSLRIIHGKGTGALRERVAEMLTKDTRVKGFRLGLWNEGGAGVTVADL
jgi:DNA mismatch repair protein MutS2